jgi:exosortase/archaeosortase family protein
MKLKSFSHPFFLFLVLMIAQMAFFYFIYYIPYLQVKLFSHVVHFYANISSSILNMLGFHTTVLADGVYSGGFSMSIKKGCDALEPMALLSSGIIAFPSNTKLKFAGLITGLSFLFILNIIRIVSLYLVGVYRPALFQIAHIEIWQVIFILFSICFWFIWIRKVSREPKKND